MIRCTLFSGCALGEPERVDLHPVAEPAQRRIGDAVALDADAVPEVGERPELADLVDEADARVHEERDRAEDRGEPFGFDLARLLHRVEHTDRRRERVRDLLHGRRARLLQVVAADVDRVPLGCVMRAPRHHVDDQPAARLGREDVRAARQVLLHDVVLRRAPEVDRCDALLLGVRDVEAEQPRRRRVDRHRRVHLPGRDAVEQRAHVAEMRDRHTDLADLALGHRRVGVVSGLGRQVERDREAGLTLREVRAIQLVRRRRGGVTRVRPHQPRLVALGHTLRHQRHSSSPRRFHLGCERLLQRDHVARSRHLDHSECPQVRSRPLHVEQSVARGSQSVDEVDQGDLRRVDLALNIDSPAKNPPIAMPYKPPTSSRSRPTSRRCAPSRARACACRRRRSVR